MHQASPGTERPRVHAQDVVGLSNLIQPAFDLSGLVLVLLSRNLDARLNLTDRYRGEMQILIADVL
jgi:hypothetical protein